MWAIVRHNNLDNGPEATSISWVVDDYNQAQELIGEMKRYIGDYMGSPVADYSLLPVAFITKEDQEILLMLTAKLKEEGICQSR